MSGKPAIRYGISAARPLAVANAAAIRSTPVSVIRTTPGMPGSCGRSLAIAGRARSRESQLVEGFGEVLVAAARQADEVDGLRGRLVAEHPGDGVRGLECRDDPL